MEEILWPRTTAFPASHSYLRQVESTLSLCSYLSLLLPSIYSYHQVRTANKPPYPPLRPTPDNLHRADQTMAFRALCALRQSVRPALARVVPASTSSSLRTAAACAPATGRRAYAAAVKQDPMTGEMTSLPDIDVR